MKKAQIEKIESEAKALLKELFSLLEITLKFEVVFAKEEEVLKVDIKETENVGLLIGKHGDTLVAIQAFLGIALRQKMGEPIRVLINIGDWRQRQEEHLVSLAKQAAERAKTTGEPQALYNLKAYQRRIIHIYFADSKEVVTESKGEGEERYLVIKPQ